MKKIFALVIVMVMVLVACDSTSTSIWETAEDTSSITAEDTSSITAEDTSSITAEDTSSITAEDTTDAQQDEEWTIYIPETAKYMGTLKWGRGRDYLIFYDDSESDSIQFISVGYRGSHTTVDHRFNNSAAIDSIIIEDGELMFTVDGDETVYRILLNEYSYPRIDKAE